MELSAANTSTRDVNKTVNGSVPVALSYKMTLNGTDDTGDIGNLPDFNATLKLNNNATIGLNNNANLLRSNIGLVRGSPLTMILGDVNYTLAKEPWNDTINSMGSYIFSGLVDNQELNLNITAERMNASLGLNASNITYGDNTNISATLVGSDGTPLSSKNVTFNINGTNYTVTTDGGGVAVLSVGGLGVGVYNVTATFNGDSDYNPIQSQDAMFNVNPLPTPPGPDPDNNNTNSSNDTNITPNYPINDGGLGTIGFLDSTGFPLILLLVLSVLGLVYYRRK